MFHHQFDVAADDVQLVLHGQLAVEMQEDEADGRQSHRAAGQDAPPEGAIEHRLLHRRRHLLQQSICPAGGAMRERLTKSTASNSRSKKTDEETE